MLLARVAVALVGIPLIVALALRGGIAFLVLVVLISVLAAWELGGLFRLAGSRPHRVLALLVAAASPVAAYLATKSGRGDAALPAALPVVAVALAAPIASLLRHGEGRRPLADVAATAWMAIYAGWLPAHLVLLSGLGVRWALYAIVLTWILDTGAYAIGRVIGRHRLAPRVSPGKTWEGAAGGTMLAAAAAIAFRGWFKGELSVAESLIMGIAVAVAGITGDLAESLLKRDAGVKDASGLLPGHGGILDRFDSLFFTGPAVYYLARIVARS